MKILILEGLHGNNKGKKCQWRLKRTDLKVGDTVVLNCYDWKIIKVVEKKKMNENDFNQKMLGISWDLGIDDYGCMVGYRVDEDGNFNIEKIEYFKTPKEVKKVRPHFEMEVVKIKNPRYQSREVIKFMGKKYEVFIEDGEVSIKKHKHQKKKGNWINGECIDKIEFPCFCSYIERVTNEKRYGKIDKNWDDIAYKDKYQISKITGQGDEISILYEDVSLKKLMINLKIKILKGKIIIWEEE